MMKRILILLLALILCGASACAEADPYALATEALYRIVLRTAEEDVTLGSGVLFMDPAVILTTESCCAEGDLYAIGRDGEHAVLFCDPVGESGAALLQLATPSAATPIELASYDAMSLPYLFGVDEEGAFRAAPLYQGLRSMYRGQETLLLSSEEGIMPGSVAIDEKGHLVGLVVTQQMEGVGMYNALEPGLLYNALTAEQYGDLFLDISCAWEDGMLTVSWVDDPRGDGMYLITISGEGNNYYTFYEAEASARSIQMAAPPGHTYYIQAQWARSEAEAIEPVWAAMSTYAVPEEGFTDYGFTQDCYLASVSAGQEVAQTLPPLTFVSVDTLADESADLYLQIKNTYDVSAEIEYPMTLELTAPDGQFFYESMGYLFSPEYEAADHFALPVEDLIASCAKFTSGKIQSGEYKLRYAINGKTAGAYTFTVHPAGTAAPAATEVPAQEDSGILTNIRAECAQGRVRVDWSGCTVPEGAQVTAYILHDGNQYFTFYDMKPGETTVDFHTVPGRACMVWVAWSLADSEERYPQREEEFVILVPPEGTPYTEYGFTNLRCALTVTSEKNAEAAGLYLPEVPLTREALANPDMTLIFQTEDIYQVDAESLEHPLAFVLYTPEGYVFVEPGYYNFAPEYSASDLWLRELNDLRESYASFAGDAAWPAGEYTFGYYIDGQIAAEITFTLE